MNSSLISNADGKSAKSEGFHDVRVFHIMNKIKPYITQEASVLDVGVGNCMVAQEISNLGNEIVTIDIKDYSVIPDIKPIIYDGKYLPFADDFFDVVTLITVLHHTRDPEQILKECIRVGKRIIVMEDTYTNWYEKYFTFIADSFMNGEFFGHPHSNKNDEGWKALFRKYGLRLVSENHHKFYYLMRSSTYILDKS